MVPSPAGDTRFATNYLMMERYLEGDVFKALQKTVLDSKWDTWRRKQRPEVKAKADEVKRLLLSRTHHSKVKELKQLCEPAVQLLRSADNPMATIGKVYWRCYQLRHSFGSAKLDALLGGDEGAIEEAREWLGAQAESRWNFLHSPMHACAYLLDPEYWHHEEHDLEVDFEASLTSRPACNCSPCTLQLWHAGTLQQQQQSAMAISM